MMYGLLIKLALAAALLAGIAAWGWAGGAASVKKEWQLATAKQVAEQLVATEQARATEQALQQKVQEAQRNGQLEKARSERTAALLRADADRVRSEFAAFIRGTPGESREACVERGEATGVVLVEAIRTSGEMAEAGEQCEADKRTLVAAWPR
jgi:hypothetical protein